MPSWFLLSPAQPSSSHETIVAIVIERNQAAGSHQEIHGGKISLQSGFLVLGTSSIPEDQFCSWWSG